MARSNLLTWPAASRMLLYSFSMRGRNFRCIRLASRISCFLASCWAARSLHSLGVLAPTNTQAPRVLGDRARRVGGRCAGVWVGTWGGKTQCKKQGITHQMLPFCAA